MIPLNASMTAEEIFNAANSSYTAPILIILFLVTYISFMIMGLIGFESKNGRKKFFIIWFLNLVLIGIGLVFIIVSPNTMLKIIEFISKIWN